MDNCEQLRLMQDVAIVEELPEIRDSIEFCENMVDTLQEELNGLRGISFFCRFFFIKIMPERRDQLKST